MVILLIKATVSNSHNVFIYMVGGICLAASIGIHTWHATTAIYTKSIFGACGNIPDPLIAILWFGCLWTLNTFLSGCFLVAIYTHHRRNSSPIYESFLKDGMFFFLLITASNIITPCLVTSAVLGVNSSIIFDIDWALQCMLITLQLSHSCNIRKGRSNFSQSLSNQYNIRESQIGHTSVSHSNHDKGNTDPWEEYANSVRMEVLAQDKPHVLKELTVASKPGRPNSIEPLTEVKNPFET
ncbi:hypothetical protein K7432_008718 [Basidiobolus ranarum]|uniref:Uncharacterized protein n=1 Tax=Basidiobolus ranarum TaxID=34480 RepID=A0ABR2WRD0_9FUNG